MHHHYYYHHQWCEWFTLLLSSLQWWFDVVHKQYISIVLTNVSLSKNRFNIFKRIFFLKKIFSYFDILLFEIHHNIIFEVHSLISFHWINSIELNYNFLLILFELQSQELVHIKVLKLSNFHFYIWSKIYLWII